MGRLKLFMILMMFITIQHIDCCSTFLCHRWFSAHLSQRLKSVVCYGYELFTFPSSSNEPLRQFQPNLVQSFLGWREFKFCSQEGPWFFPRGDNNKRVKTYWQILKSFSPEPLDHFEPNLAQNIFGWSKFKFIQMKDPSLFQGEIRTK